MDVLIRLGKGVICLGKGVTCLGKGVAHLGEPRLLGEGRLRLGKLVTA